jgi:hypothetical protein
VEPAGEGRCPAYETGLAGKDEERGLEGVLGVGLVPERAAADVQHHGPVTAQQDKESSFVLSGTEALE